MEPIKWHTPHSEKGEELSLRQHAFISVFRGRRYAVKQNGNISLCTKASALEDGSYIQFEDIKAEPMNAHKACRRCLILYIDRLHIEISQLQEQLNNTTP